MTRIATAKIILRAASNLGVKVGTNGIELLMLAPARIPTETRRWFEAALDQHRAAVIAVIMAENAMTPPNTAAKRA
jgi:hypothetical protein